MIYRLRLLSRRLFTRCPDCRRVEYFLGLHIGKHQNCFPF